jgi:hypothetical protein
MLNEGLVGLVLGTLLMLLGWLLWTAAIYLVGVKFFPGPAQAGFAQLFRTLGLANAPGVIRVLGLIPGAGIIVFPAAMVWIIVVFVVAVRETLGYTSTLKAAAVCLGGWFLQLGVSLFLYFMAGLLSGSAEG